MPGCIFPSLLRGLWGAVKSTWSLGTNILKSAVRKNPSLMCLEMNSWLDQKYTFTQHEYINNPKTRGASKALQVGVWLTSHNPWQLRSTLGNSLHPSWTETHEQKGMAFWSWSWSLWLCRQSLQQGVATSEKRWVVVLRSFFWQKRSQHRRRGPGMSAHMLTCTQDGPALGGPYGGGQGGGQKGWIWVCGHLPSVCYWSICQITPYSSPVLLQHFLVEFGTHLFSFLPSCRLFVADTIGCQSISWTIFFCFRAKLFRLCPTLCEPKTEAHQAPLSMGFSRQEYLNGSPCPSPGDLPNAGIEPVSLTSPSLAGGFFTTRTIWEALQCSPLPLRGFH